MENIYLKDYNKKDCNGCKICTYTCTTNAISMVEDEEGFEYPKIDESKCIKCEKCKKICSNFNINKKTQKAYMTINKNKTELMNSSSGGMFIILANYVISKDGVVFGVKLDEKLMATHDFAENIEDCKKFQGSKYLKSEIGNSYEKVKEFLDNGRYVLFTGTPCQCNALKIYLKEDYDKLLLCDIICHATPSSKIFKMYKKELEESRNKKIKDISFRDKSIGWRNQATVIKYSDNSKEVESTFFKAFVNELIDRPSCYNCKFCGLNRVTDFSIGDFWGIEKILPDVKDNNTGISLILVNTPKAIDIFKDVNQYMEYIEVTPEDAMKFNHNSNVKMHKNREKFFIRLDSMSVIKNMKQCIEPNFIIKFFKKAKNIPIRILSKIKRIVKGNIQK